MSVFACLALLVSASAPKPTPEQLADLDIKRQLDAVLETPGLAGADVGVFAQRLDDGTVVYEHNADELLVPASNIKLITTGAALSLLGPGFRFRTEIWGIPTREGTVASDIFVKGYGDPWLLPERLWHLAGRLRAMGVVRIEGDIVVDDSYFDGSPHAGGAKQDRSSNAYMAPAGALSVGFNAVQVHVVPGIKTGDRPRVTLDPPSDYFELKNLAVTTSRRRSRLSVYVEPLEGRSRMVVRGRMHHEDTGQTFWRRVDYPALYAGHTLRALLQQHGIQVGSVRRGTLPAEDSRPAVLERLVSSSSPPLALLINRINKHSNNFMASQLARVIGAELYGAPGNWDKGAKALSAFLASCGIAPGSYSLGNASGLHDVNRFSARQIGRIVRCVLQQDSVAPEFVHSLPVAGRDGTLEERMTQGQATERLRAKTGTLSYASALSGIVTRDNGKRLAFAILVNNFRRPIEHVWMAQDSIGHILATHPDTSLSGPLAIRER